MDRLTKDGMNVVAMALATVLATTVLVLGLFLCQSSVTPVSAQTPSSRTVHALGAALPTSLGSPTTVEGVNLATSTINVTSIVLVNTDTSDHTVTVQDCQSTPFKLFDSFTIAAKTMWPVPLGGMRFTGCFKWVASSATVMGSVVGER